VQQVICGGHHSAALTASGRVFTWGFDDDGRLGHGQTGHQTLPRAVETLAGMEIVSIACGCWHSAALTSNGAVYTWGSCKSGQLGQAHRNSAPIPRVVLEGIGGGVVQIACGTAHTAALTEAGELYTWGKCDDGRLGYDCKTDQTTPKLVEALRGKHVIDMQCGVYDTAALVRGDL
jgi:E3 ubiquitin-protein ligase HERC2